MPMHFWRRIVETRDALARIDDAVETKLYEIDEARALAQAASNALHWALGANNAMASVMASKLETCHLERTGVRSLSWYRDVRVTESGAPPWYREHGQIIDAILELEAAAARSVEDDKFERAQITMAADAMRWALGERANEFTKFEEYTIQVRADRYYGVARSGPTPFLWPRSSHPATTGAIDAIKE